MTQMIPVWLDNCLQPLDKLVVHQRGLRHPAVSVFIHRDGQMLLQQRAAGKYHSPLLWANACCTHPHWDEDPAACAHRRLAEELGITGLELQPAGVVEYRAAVGGGLVEHEAVTLFHAAAPPGLIPRPDPAEVAALRWVTAAELKAGIREQPRHYSVWLQVYLARPRPELFG